MNLLLNNFDFLKELFLEKVGLTDVLSKATMIECLIILALVFAFILTVMLIVIVIRSPFSYPYFIYEFDVSGKRNPHIDDYLDMFLISDGYIDIQKHQKLIERWKKRSNEQIERSVLKKYRRKQYEKILDDKDAFQFYFIRSQTRYRQQDYVKSAYKVFVEDGCYFYDYDYITDRYGQLASIDFECSLRKYHSKNQRKLATRELREKIMKRDNYTCQLCGKYMPDEVGLQIDHIIPIAKGGKTVTSNLRVLCSKCNGSKSDKMPV